MSVLSPRYLYRLATYPLIKPIGMSEWYSPKALVKGGAPAAELAVCSESALANPAVIGPIADELFAHHTHALLVLHRGRLVAERYGRFSRGHTSNSKSMMKSVLALLLGIAEAEGHLAVEQAASDFFPEWRNDDRRHITIEHLLTMQSGLRSDLRFPGGRLLPDILPLYLGTDIEAFALSVPAVARPGTYWEYNNTNSQLLGILLERATGRSYADYLSEKLWQPLGCEDAHVWLDKPGQGGRARTFATLFARPHDWARVGELVRRRGECNGRQLVPAEWLARMETPRNADRDYGYHIWLRAHRTRQVRGIPEAQHFYASEDFLDPEAFYMEGMHGQCLLVSRRHELVAVRIGEKPEKARWDGSYLLNALIRALEA